MKKIILLLLAFLTIPIIKIKAYEKFYWGDIALDYKITAGKNDMEYNYYPTLKHSSDGSSVYCIEMFKAFIADTNYEVYTYNSQLFNLDANLLNKINLIGNYGYNYPGHEDKKWYGLTQYLIWKEIGLDYIYFTDDNDNIVDVYQDELKEINDLVDNHYNLPSFANEVYNYYPDKDFEIIDTNNILSNFDIVYTDINAKIEGNTLKINKLNNGRYTIEFKKKKYNNDNYYLYYLEQYQALFKPGNISDVTFKLDISINSGDITIYKSDSENIDRSDATLKGAIYGVYNTNDEIVYGVQTDELGIAKIKNAPYGSYYIKEISPSYGYRISKNIHSFTINDDNKNIVIYSYEEAIKDDINITKYYEDNEGYSYESGISFELYKNNYLLDTYTTDELGNIKLKLDYGTYTLKQVSGKEGYTYLDDYTFVVDNGEPKDIKLYNKLIRVDINITKYYEDVDDYKVESDASFGLYKNDNLIGTYTTDELGNIKLRLNYGTYTLKQISGKEGYTYLDDYTFVVDNGEPKDINLYNKLIKVDVNITKYYEDIDDYKVESNAMFELYKNNNLIKTYTTDELGNIKLKLDYGTYVLKQISGKEGYTFIDDYTFVIDNGEPKNINLYNKLNYIEPVSTSDELLVVEVPNTGVNYNNIKYIYLIIIGMFVIVASMLIKKYNN